MIEEALAQLADVAGLDPEQVALVRGTVDVCRSANADHHAPGELGDVMVVADRCRSRLEAQAARSSVRFAASADWAFDGPRTPGSWLATYTKVSRPQGNGLIATAKTLAECPHVAEAYGAGRLGSVQVRLLFGVRLVKVPKLLEVWTAQEAYLVETVAGLSVAATSQFLAAWLDAACDGDDPRYRDPVERNHFSLAGLGQGRRRPNGEFDTEASAAIQNAMDTLIKTWHADGSLVDDTRSLAELQADALVELVAKGAHHLHPNRPSVSVIIDYDTLVRRSGEADEAAEESHDHAHEGEGKAEAERRAANEGEGAEAGAQACGQSDQAGGQNDQAGGRGDRASGAPESDDPMPYRSSILGHGPVPPEAIRRMCCNADITRIVLRGASEPLDVGREHRLATPAIRKAVWARSEGWCELCHHTRLTWCQLHHIEPWWDHGETSVENSLLVCNHCHHLLHEGRYTAKRTAHGFQLLRPDGSLPRLPLRNRPHPADTT